MGVELTLERFHIGFNLLKYGVTLVNSLHSIDRQKTGGKGQLTFEDSVTETENWKTKVRREILHRFINCVQSSVVPHVINNYLLTI